MNHSDPDAGVYVTLDGLARLRHRAKGFSLLPRQPVSSLLAGAHASKLRGRGLDFDEIRKYLPGDDPRAIDWKVTARMRSPHIRIFTEERERPALIVVDQRLGMFFGTVRMMKSVAAAQLAALATWRTIAVRDRVGGVVFDDSDAVEVRPQRTRTTVMRLLRAVTDRNRALRADSMTKPSPGMLNEALRRARRVATHDFLVLLVTDGDGADAETREILTTIARHNDVVVAFVFDPLEADLPEADGLVVSDGARQMEVDATWGRLREDFRRAFDERRATAKQFLLSREVAVLPIRTDAEITDQIVRELGGRPGLPHG
jgi:uncharacterized protein (DUF58 family)